MKLGELYYKITGDSRQLQGELKKSQRQTKKTAGKMKGMLKAIGFAAAAAGVVKVTSALIKAASDAEEVQNKFDVVFKGLEKQSGQVASNLAENYGLSNVESKELLSNTADLLNGFGIAKDEALDLSEGVQKLAVDLGSFNNVSSARASDALTKALLGEREAVKQLGVAITDAELKRFAEAAGKNYEAMDKGEKAILTYKLAVEQSQNAIGDFSRSSDSFANTMKQVKARFSDIVVTLGEELLPIATKVLHGVLKLAEGFKALPSTIQAVIAALTTLGAALIVGKILGVVSALKKAKIAMSGFGKSMINAIKNANKFKLGMAAIATAAAAAGAALAKWQQAQEDAQKRKIWEGIWEVNDAFREAARESVGFEDIIQSNIEHFRELGNSAEDFGMVLNNDNRLTHNYGNTLKQMNNNIEVTRQRLQENTDAIQNNIDAKEIAKQAAAGRIWKLADEAAARAEENEWTKAQTKSYLEQNRVFQEASEDLGYLKESIEKLNKEKQKLIEITENLEEPFSAEQYILQTAMSGIREIEGRHKYLGDSVDVTKEKIDLFSNILVEAYKKKIPMSSSAVELLQKKLKDLKEEAESGGGMSKILEQLSEGLDSISARYRVYGDEIDVTKEKQALFNKLLVQAYQKGLPETSDEVRILKKMMDELGKTTDKTGKKQKVTFEDGLNLANVFASSMQSLAQANIDAMNNELAMYDRRAEAAEASAERVQKSEIDLLESKKANLEGMLEKQRETAQTTAAINSEQAIKEVNAEIIKKRKLEKIKKDRAKKEYQMKLAEWKMNKAMIWANAALAVMALMRGFPWGLPGTLLKVANIGLIMGVAGKQAAVLADAKPQPPKYAQGATNIQRDHEATLDRGEMVLDPITADNVRKGKTSIGGQGTSAQDINISLMLDSDKLYEAQFKASQSGRYKLAKEALV